MSAAITFVCWKWQSSTYHVKYSAEHVNVLARMLARHAGRDHRLVCVTDDPTGVECETHPLWSDCRDLPNQSGHRLPQCHRRLRIFEAETTRAMGVADGEYVFSIDLDVVLVRSMTKMLDAEGDFWGWSGVGGFRPLIYNGSIFKFRAGALEHLWYDFDPTTSPTLVRKAKYFGSDQAWLSYKLANQPEPPPGWNTADGVYSYARHARRTASPPDNAVIVSFNGKHKPWMDFVQQESPWIARYWR